MFYQLHLTAPVDAVSDGVCVVAGHHDAHLLRVVPSILQRLDPGNIRRNNYRITAAPQSPGETLVQHGVVHGAGRLVVRVDRVLVAEQLGAGPLLLSQSQLSTRQRTNHSSPAPCRRRAPAWRRSRSSVSWPAPGPG